MLGAKKKHENLIQGFSEVVLIVVKKIKNR